MRIVPISTKVRLAASMSPSGSWRSRLAWSLRTVADRLTGQVTIAIEVKASQKIDEHDIATAFVKGMEVSKELLFEQCRAKEIESLMRRHQPHLYAEDKQ
ncbi:hypothetical protein [Litchfieldella xinjiangensis]|uniref:hypothetical protein n=1 Tax=Litchfieldella xinjiangensis TaxID=1166948 RepID=UPI0005BE23CC|nr:hypothetical protein [Halomonas xinjiangensis]